MVIFGSAYFISIVSSSVWLGRRVHASSGCWYLARLKKWQLTLIITNPCQGDGKYSVYYGWCTRPYFPHPNVKGK